MKKKKVGNVYVMMLACSAQCYGVCVWACICVNKSERCVGFSYNVSHIHLYNVYACDRDRNGIYWPCCLCVCIMQYNETAVRNGIHIQTFILRLINSALAQNWSKFNNGRWWNWFTRGILNVIFFTPFLFLAVSFKRQYIICILWHICN